jgi:hypothetical protein
LTYGHDKMNLGLNEVIFWDRRSQFWVPLR